MIGMALTMTMFTLLIAPAQGSRPGAAGGASGRVVDAATHAPLAGVTVSVDGRTVMTAGDGRFALALPPGAHTVAVSAIGYLPTTIDVPVNGDAITRLEIELTASRQYSETVEAVAPLTPATAPATTRLDPLQARNAAGGFDNAFFALQTLPGVVSTGDLDSRLAVRGGGPDQNLTMMDGVEVYNPFRLFGLSTMFNPQIVSRLDFTAGGFGAKYGDRLSSLLVVETRDGARARRMQGQTSLSIIDSNGLVEGRIPGGSWLVTGRRSYLNAVVSSRDGEKLPDYADLQAKLSVGLWAGLRLTLFSLGGHDDFRTNLNSTQRPRDAGAIKARTYNTVRSARAHAVYGSRVTSTANVSWYQNVDALDVDGIFETTSRRANVAGDTAFALQRVRLTNDLTVRDLAVREELAVSLGGAHVLETGFEFHGLQTRVDLVDRSEGLRVPGSTATDARLRITSARDSQRTGAWLQGRFAVGPDVTVEPGVRFDRSTVNGRSVLAPRLAAAYRMNETTKARVSGGLFTQSPGYEKLVQSELLLDLSKVKAPLRLGHERSWQAIAGLEHQLSPRTTLSLESFVKSFDNLIVPERETTNERTERLARYDYPLEFAADVPREVVVTSRPTNVGTGRAYGLELFASRAASGVRGLSGWMSYTWSRAERSEYGLTRPFAYDRRHAVSVVSEYRFGPRWSVASTLRAGSGFPRTRALGVRVAATEDRLDADDDGSTDEIVPERDAQGRLVYDVDFGGPANVNRARMPWVARLDLRTTWRPGWTRGRGEIYLDLINATDRRNAFSIDSELAFDPAGTRPRIVETQENALPLLPSIGVRWRF